MEGVQHLPGKKTYSTVLKPSRRDGDHGALVHSADAHREGAAGWVVQPHRAPKRACAQLPSACSPISLFPRLRRRAGSAGAR